MKLKFEDVRKDNYQNGIYSALVIVFGKGFWYNCAMKPRILVVCREIKSSACVSGCERSSI